jgi:hypothetical protein
VKKVLVVGHNADLSLELRAKRRLTVEFIGAELLANEFVVVVHNGIPIWLAEIVSFSVPPGSPPKRLTLELGGVVLLEGKWVEASSYVPREQLSHGQNVHLDVAKLFEIGDPLGSKESPGHGALCAAEAKLRLAWTYGVKEGHVKISIDL